MKLIFRLSILLIITLITSGCYHYETLDKVSDEDLHNYLIIDSYDPSYNDSPLSYNVIKGSNPANEYDWMVIRYSDFKKSTFGLYYTYIGDKSKLLCRAFPDSDIIMVFNDKFYIGTKKKEFSK